MTHRYLCADSRSVFAPSDTIFAALNTSLGDGHRFIPELYARGVRHFIVDHLPADTEKMNDAHFEQTGNVQAWLDGKASALLNGFTGGIAVTGSHGKTVLKELLYSALMPLCSVCRSPRSWNSRIGVPLSIWEMTSDGLPEHIITEIGIDGPGQADAIAAILGSSHTIGVLTPISTEHDNAFASHSDKIAEKARIFAGCKTVVYDCSDPEAGQILERELPGAKLIAVRQESFPSIYHALADAVLSALGYDAHSRSHIASLPLVSTRREISSAAFGNTVVRDNFTPDILSLRMALDFMHRRATPRHPSALILGQLTDTDATGDAIAMAKQFGIEHIVCLPEKPGTELSAIISGYIGGSLLHNEQILLFGRNDDSLRAMADALECAGHETTLEVDLNAVVHNYNYYRSLVPKGTGIVAMVKAGAYGAGAVEIGKTLQSHGAAALAVAVIEEGIELRDAGITMPVIVLNPLTNRYPALFANHLEPTVFSPEELDRLIREAEAAGVSAYPIHIKLDTGMHRVGFLPEQLDGIGKRLARTGAVRVSSVLSHLATADCLDMDDYTLSQIDVFRQMTDRLRDILGYPFRRHLLNTAGMMRFAGALDYEMGRLGIGLYGISPYPGDEALRLKPVSSLRTHIISIKHWPAGTPIGYGCKGRTTRPSVIATIPIGYADGINRHLGRGNASFIVSGTACPTIGNICMDQCMIDVTDAKGAAVGTEVEIFGPHQRVEVLSDILGTIPYEILTSVSPRVKRVYTLR